MKITIFESLPTAGKAPISPFGDKTFVFKTFEVEDNQLLHVIANNFILNEVFKVSYVEVTSKIHGLFFN